MAGGTTPKRPSAIRISGPTTTQRVEEIFHVIYDASKHRGGAKWATCLLRDQGWSSSVFSAIRPAVPHSRAAAGPAAPSRRTAGQEDRGRRPGTWGNSSLYSAAPVSGRPPARVRPCSTRSRPPTWPSSSTPDVGSSAHSQQTSRTFSRISTTQPRPGEERPARFARSARSNRFAHVCTSSARAVAPIPMTFSQRCDATRVRTWSRGTHGGDVTLPLALAFGVASGLRSPGGSPPPSSLRVLAALLSVAPTFRSAVPRPHDRRGDPRRPCARSNGGAHGGLPRRTGAARDGLRRLGRSFATCPCQ